MQVAKRKFIIEKKPDAACDDVKKRNIHVII